MAKDYFHNIVRRALEEDGWLITHDPYIIRTDLLNEPLVADLGAEKALAAAKGESKILVEVKSFLRESVIYEFHAAIGQILSYQVNMEIQEPDRLLFLAIPKFAWDKMEQQPFYDVILERERINYLIFDPEEEKIVLWKKY